MLSYFGKLGSTQNLDLFKVFRDIDKVPPSPPKRPCSGQTKNGFSSESVITARPLRLLF